MMGTVLAVASFVIALPTMLLTLVVTAEILSALRPPRRARPDGRRRDIRCAVVVPAHNEELCIAATLQSIKADLESAHRLVVVADNCTDSTAAICRDAGAEVIERFDQTFVGKGYAMDAGIRYLEANTPPDVVIFVDADCRIAPGCFDRLIEAAAQADRPIQARYLIEGDRSSAKARIREFAFRVKNYVRPLGSARFGIPVLLFGAGMAFPWQAIRRVNLASGHIAEDVKLGLDLSLLDFEPRFCPEASVTSVFPPTEAGTRVQRTRWEHGHFALIREYVPKLVAAGFKRGRPSLLALALDLLVPPLALLLILDAIVALPAVLLLLVQGPSLWLVPGLAAFPLLGVALVVGWRSHCKDTIRPSDLLTIPLYALSKLTVLWSFIRRPQQLWVRSDR